MAFDPITSWHTEDRSVRTARTFGEHHADDIARHVADARPPRRIIRQLLQTTWHVGRTAAQSRHTSTPDRACSHQRSRDTRVTRPDNTATLRERNAVAPARGASNRTLRGGGRCCRVGCRLAHASMPTLWGIQAVSKLVTTIANSSSIASRMWSKVASVG